MSYTDHRYGIKGTQKPILTTHCYTRALYIGGAPIFNFFVSVSFLLK